MKTETLKVSWKHIWKAKYDKRNKSKCEEDITSIDEIKKGYCKYIAENHHNKHELRTVEGTKLFELLENTVIPHKSGDLERFDKGVYVDGVYFGGKLLFIKNPRVM